MAMHYNGAGRMEYRPFYDRRNFDPLVLSMAAIGNTFLAFEYCAKQLKKVLAGAAYLGAIM